MFGGQVRADPVAVLSKVKKGGSEGNSQESEGRKARKSQTFSNGEAAHLNTFPGLGGGFAELEWLMADG